MVQICLALFSYVCGKLLACLLIRNAVYINADVHDKLVEKQVDMIKHCHCAVC